LTKTVPETALNEEMTDHLGYEKHDPADVRSGNIRNSGTVIKEAQMEPYGNRIYWETCGNPDGVPVVVVHGGPGSGYSLGHRRSFDPERFRIIVFDQRNCGRSTPHASDPAADMSLNTTDHLIRDMEQLRENLGINTWMLHGGSWS
jgi:pimeloyl-ACP methyl ester carboxylesterase